MLTWRWNREKEPREKEKKDSAPPKVDEVVADAPEETQPQEEKGNGKEEKKEQARRRFSRLPLLLSSIRETLRPSTSTASSSTGEVFGDGKPSSHDDQANKGFEEQVVSSKVYRPTARKKSGKEYQGDYQESAVPRSDLAESSTLVETRRDGSTVVGVPCKDLKGTKTNKESKPKQFEERSLRCKEPSVLAEKAEKAETASDETSTLSSAATADESEWNSEVATIRGPLGVDGEAETKKVKEEDGQNEEEKKKTEEAEEKAKQLSELRLRAEVLRQLSTDCHFWFWRVKDEVDAKCAFRRKPRA